MKLKSRKIISMALVFFMMLTILPLAPVTAHAMDSSVDFDIRISGTRISDIHGTASGAGWTYKGTGGVPRITLNNYEGSGITIFGLNESMDFYIAVKGDCKIEGDSDLCGIINFAPAASVASAFRLTLVDNAKLEITSPQGIYNAVDQPYVYIDGDGQIDIQSSTSAIYCHGLATQGGANGEVSVSDNIALNANGTINIGWRATGNNVDVHFREPYLRVSSGATVSLKSDRVVLEGYNPHTDKFPKLDMPENYIQVAKNDGKELHIFTPKFKEQNPAGSDGENTGLNVMTGEPQTYTFNSNTAPDGYYVEKTATLKGLFAGLDFGDSAKTITPVTDGSAATLKHTFSKAGLYQLTETLKLYKEGESTPVGTKTHVFLISVSEKPLVTPTITDQPENATKVTGSHELSATAKNADRARWYKIGSDGNLTALDTSFSAGVATTTISSNTPGDRYYCAFWSVDNKIAQTDVVTVCFAPTVIAGETVTVSPGGKAFLRVTENGCNHYDAESGWYAPGSSVEVSGDKYYTMGTTLAIQNVDTSDAGIYTYKYVTHGETVTGTVKLVVEAPAAAEYIDTFEIYIDEPIFGKTAPTTATVPSSAEYKVKEIKWTGGVSSLDSIINNSSASVNITLEKTGTKQFKSQSGDLIGSVNGLTATAYGCGTAKDEITVTIMYNAPGTSRKVIMPEPDSVSVTTEKLTFEKDKEYTASDNMKITGTFACDHNDLAEDYQHTGMIYSLESTTDNNAMPTGLTLNQNGSITGTPTAAGTYTVVILAHSANGNNTPSTGSGHVVKTIEIIVEDKDDHTHDWDIEHPEVVTPANCTTDGTSKITCSGCTETVEITTPATGHNWGEWSSDKSGHWKYCAYGCGTIVVDKEAHSYGGDRVCDICNYKKPSSGGSYGGGSYVAPDKDADSKLRIVMQINNRNILVNGSTITNDVAPVIVGDRTLVPIRVVTELLGGSADWDNDTRTVTLKIDGKTMNMTIGKPIPGFGTSAVIMNDRTYVPVRYVMEKLGAEVEWINATQQIVIEK